MNEWNDNKMENIFFEMILNNNQLNSEILKLYYLINKQKISIDDKKIINEKVFWFWIINEDEEINQLLKLIRNDKIKNYLLYKMIFELLEEIFNIENSKHIDLLLSNTAEEIQTDLIYYIKFILDFVYDVIEKELKSKKWFFDNINDYLNDKELESVLENLDTLFSDVIKQILVSNETSKIKAKIINEVDKRNKISNIK